MAKDTSDWNSEWVVSVDTTESYAEYQRKRKNKWYVGHYAKNKDKINARRREVYRLKKEAKSNG